MLVKCIDPRFTTNTWAYMSSRGWQNLYSQFNIAGGPIGIVAPVFADWQKTYWDNLKITYDLHEVKRVVAITHRDCGAAVVAYGERHQDRPGLRDQDPPGGAAPSSGPRSSSATPTSRSSSASWT